MSGTPTQAIPAIASFLQVYTLVNTNPTTIGGITDFTYTRTLKTVDASTMGSPSGWEEVVGLMKSLGKITFTIQWLPNDPSGLQQQLVADLYAGQLRQYQILDPGTPTRTHAFFALVESVGIPYKCNGLLVANVSLAGSGVPVDS